MGNLNGIQISQHLQITHLLFVDDVLIFCSRTVRDVDTISEILIIFSTKNGMEINAGKYMLSTNNLEAKEPRHISVTFPFQQEVLDGGLKYLIFFLKPNDYLKKDWKWLLEELEKRLKSWSHKWLSRDG